jgi:hypothetical protein
MFIGITLDKVSIYRVVVATLPFRINQVCFTQVLSKYSLCSLKTRAVPTPQMRNSDLVKIVYLINQFPKVSHSFIYREIQGLERQSIDRAVEPLAGLFARGSL